jgi:hypothetical protein
MWSLALCDLAAKNVVFYNRKKSRLIAQLQPKKRGHCTIFFLFT